MIQEPAKAEIAGLDLSGKPMTASEAVLPDGIWLLPLGRQKISKKGQKRFRNLPKRKDLSGKPTTASEAVLPT